MANDIVLETRGLVKKFGDAVILNGIDFTLHDKEVAVILGPSGCGKSTFLRCLIGLEPIQGGNILLKGKPLEFGSTLRSGIGIVGVVSVAAVCVTPYLQLAVHYVLYKLAAGIAESFADKRVGRLIDGFADVYGFLLGMVGVASLILFLSIVSSMKAVTG